MTSAWTKRRGGQGQPRQFGSQPFHSRDRSGQVSRGRRAGLMPVGNTTLSMRPLLLPVPQKIRSRMKNHGSVGPRGRLAVRAVSLQLPQQIRRKGAEVTVRSIFADMLQFPHPNNGLRCRHGGRINYIFLVLRMKARTVDRSKVKRLQTNCGESQCTRTGGFKAFVISIPLW